MHIGLEFLIQIVLPVILHAYWFSWSSYAVSGLFIKQRPESIGIYKDVDGGTTNNTVIGLELLVQIVFLLIIYTYW